MYYCNADHIVLLCKEQGITLTESDAKILIEEAMDEAEAESKRKFYAHRSAIANRKRADTGAAMVKAEDAFAADKIAYYYGKRVAGILKSKLQQKFSRNIDIYKPTEKIIDSQFVAICNAA